jgi:hypothetical protein
MVKVVRMSHVLEERMSKQWGEELLLSLHSVGHPSLTNALLSALREGMEMIEESKLRFGCIPLGIEFYADDVGEAVLFLHDRYDLIEFSDKGYSRNATAEELGRDENDLTDVFPFMSIVLRPLKAAQKLQLRGREVKDILTFGNEFKLYCNHILGFDVEQVEQSALVHLLLAIPIRLASQYGYRIHGWVPMTHEKDGKFLVLSMTGDGLEIEMDLNVLYLHNQYTKFLRRMDVYYNTPAT